eukprot:10832926-Alexandrium_andersonii.AAC.1
MGEAASGADWVELDLDARRVGRVEERHLEQRAADSSSLQGSVLARGRNLTVFAANLGLIRACGCAESGASEGGRVRSGPSHVGGFAPPSGPWGAGPGISALEVQSAGMLAWGVPA